MKALIDSDILRYEIGFASEVAWKATIEARGEELDESNSIPPWAFVEHMLHERIDYILDHAKADTYKLYLSSGKNFRHEVAKTKPYKGNRKNVKPWHFDNLTVYMRDVLGASVSYGIEADDAMAIDHIQDADTIICSRDKDLRQVPGWLYSWELGNQPSFGPINITDLGTLEYTNKKLKGTGFLFFCAQVLMGDTSDNIPGLPGVGPKAAWDLLRDSDDKRTCLNIIRDTYIEHYGDEDAFYRLEEQGKLCWIVRKWGGDTHDGGTYYPVTWEIGMTG